MNKLATFLSMKLYKKNQISHEEIDFYRFSIEVLFTQLSLFLSIIAIGIIMNSVTEVLLFLFIFSPLRTYSEGYHSNSFIRCVLLTNITCVICLVISKEYAMVLYEYKFVLLTILSLLIVLELYLHKIQQNYTNNKKYYIFLAIDYILLLMLMIYSIHYYLIVMYSLLVVISLQCIWIIKQGKKVVNK